MMSVFDPIDHRRQFPFSLLSRRTPKISLSRSGAACSAATSSTARKESSFFAKADLLSVQFPLNKRVPVQPVRGQRSELPAPVGKAVPAGVDDDTVEAVIYRNEKTARTAG
jgi:hypothetical protein